MPEAGIPWSLEHRQAISVLELVRDERCGAHRLLRQDGPCFSKSRDRCSSVPKARLPVALQEAVRWWSRRGGAFPLLSIALAFHGGLLELAQSGHAAGEPLAPSKPPVPWASPAGSPLSGRVSSLQVGWIESCFGVLQQLSLLKDRPSSGSFL